MDVPRRLVRFLRAGDRIGLMIAGIVDDQVESAELLMECNRYVVTLGLRRKMSSQIGC